MHGSDTLVIESVSKLDDPTSQCTCDIMVFDVVLPTSDNSRPPETY